MDAVTESDGIDAILKERGSRYGDFMGHANVTQLIKQSIRLGKNWSHMRNDQKEALEMIAHKIGRIINGDPNYRDSWDDIAGYALLVSRNLPPSKVSDND